MSSVPWWSLQWQTFANVCVVVLYAQQCASSRRELLVRDRTHSPYTLSDRAVPSRTLKFELCNGFANQRIALASGIIFAYLLDRYAVLPEAVANGIQTTDDWRHGESEPHIQLSDMYDTEYLVQSLHRSNVQAVETKQAPAANQYHAIKLSDAPDSDVLEWLRTFADHAHLRIDCPLFRLPPMLVVAHAIHFWAVLESLRPSQALMPLVDRGVTQLHAQMEGESFNFLHLRVENDWLGHCQRWSNIADGVVRDNCFNNTFNLAEHFENKGVDKVNPLYIASFWEEASPYIVKKVLQNLILAGYHVVRQADLYPNKDNLSLLGVFGRERMACVDYYIALEAEKFIGNSVSSFSALLLLERERQGAWSSYYNGGNVPMSEVLPLYHLPWVFTYNSWSSKYNYMLKAAVRSGLHHGRLKPYCVFAGDDSAPMFNWLKGHGVTMIHATPAWIDRMVAILNRSNDSNIAHSHLYASTDLQIGTWQRVDIPILTVLSQYEYVLFTDADVYFRGPVTLNVFKLPLPKTVGMATEAADMFPYNAGIMLMHLPAMRQTYDGFIDFIFKNEHGLFFPGYGPGDQGAINQFYEDSVKGAVLSQKLNAKPYHPNVPSAIIVHFHGPKPVDYLAFAKDGNCAFAYLCKDGVDNAFCSYALEWAHFIQDEEIGQQVRIACNMGLREHLMARSALKSPQPEVEKLAVAAD